MKFFAAVSKVIRITCRSLIWAILLLGFGEILVRVLVGEDGFRVHLDRSFSLFTPEAERQHPFSHGATNVLKIAIVGDSMALGVGNHRYDRCSERLEWLMNLETDPPPAEVDLYARPAALYEQVGAVRKAIAEGASLVIVAIHLNDTEDWTAADQFLDLRTKTLPQPPGKFIRFLTNHSELAALTYNRSRQIGLRRGFDRYYDFLYAETYPGLDKFKQAVVEMKQICVSNNVLFAGTLFPLLNQDLRTGHYPFWEKHELVGSIFSANDVPFLDLADAFADISPARVQNIPGIDPHGNEIAHRIAADALFRFLLEEHLVDSDYFPNKRADKTYISHWKQTFDKLGIRYHKHHSSHRKTHGDPDPAKKSRS